MTALWGKPSFTVVPGGWVRHLFQAKHLLPTELQLLKPPTVMLYVRCSSVWNSNFVQWAAQSMAALGWRKWIVLAQCCHTHAVKHVCSRAAAAAVLTQAASMQAKFSGCRGTTGQWQGECFWVGLGGLGDVLAWGGGGVQMWPLGHIQASIPGPHGLLEPVLYSRNISKQAHQGSQHCPQSKGTNVSLP